MAVDLIAGIQMKPKEVAKTFMMISLKNPLVSEVYIKIFKRFEG